MISSPTRTISVIFTDAALGQASKEDNLPVRNGRIIIIKAGWNVVCVGPVGLLSADPLSRNYFDLIDTSVCRAEQCSGVSWFNASGEAKSWSFKVELQTRSGRIVVQALMAYFVAKWSIMQRGEETNSLCGGVLWFEAWPASHCDFGPGRQRRLTRWI